MILFKSLPREEQDKIRARWHETAREEDEGVAAPGKVKDPLFHTTSHDAMDRILDHGLTPRSGGGVFQHGGYGEHSQGKVFLSDSPDAAATWQNKVFQQLEDRHGDEEEVGRRVPVMLRVKTRETERDPVGDKDVAGSRYTETPVPPEDLEFWHPKRRRWEALSAWGDDTDAEHAVSDRSEEEGVIVDDEAFMPTDDDAYERDDAATIERERREREERRREERERRRPEEERRLREEREREQAKYLEPATRQKWIDKIKREGAKFPIPAMNTKPGVFPKWWQDRLKVDEHGRPLPDHPLEDSHEAAARRQDRFATYSPEFLLWTRRQRFPSPRTGDRIKFVSLPPDEQAKIYEQWSRTRRKDPSRGPYDHLEFRRKGDETETILRETLGEDDRQTRLLDLAGMRHLGPAVEEATVEARETKDGSVVRVSGRGKHGLYFRRELHYDRDGRPDHVNNDQFKLDEDAPAGTATRMIAGQLEAADREGFRRVRTFASGAPGEKNTGYYVWPRIGFNLMLRDDPEFDEKMPPDLKAKVNALADADPEVTYPEMRHLMMLPEGRDWWKENGWAVDADIGTGSHKYSAERQIIDAYVQGKTRAAFQLSEEDEKVLDEAWDRARRELERRKVARVWLRRAVTAAQMSEFQKEVEGERFPNPETGNRVLFVSLPRREQARLFAEWRRQQRGDEPQKERERGLIKVDKEEARELAKHIAERASKWKVRDPDERIGDRFTPGMGRGSVTMGTLDITDVRGRRFERPLRLTLGKPNPELWKAGRKLTTGGRVVSRQSGQDDPGMPMYVQVDLNPDVTYRDLAENSGRLEREVYNILVHEMTHARDVLMTQRAIKRHRQKHEVPEDTPDVLRTEAENRAYYNKPTEARAFKQQVAEEVRHELERRHKDEDEPEWIPSDADAVMDVLWESVTWGRVRPYLNPKNRRKFLETVASVVRKFKEERGGPVG